MPLHRPTDCDNVTPISPAGDCVNPLANPRRFDWPLPANLFVALLLPLAAWADPAPDGENDNVAAPKPAAALACPEPALAPVITAVPDREGAPVTFYARRFEATRNQPGEARGNVEIFRADQHLATEAARYDPATGILNLPAPLRYEDSQVNIAASSGLYGFNEESGDFYDVEYGFAGSSAHGGADSAHVSGGNRSEMRRIWFTTCPGDDPEWRLSAKELELRHDEGVGVARGARLELGKVPVLYVPWLTFPIDDRRKSGFLYPSLSTANDNGLEVGIPYYWNIAPNQDATITPRLYTDRGLMGTGEYRLLTRRTSSVFDGSYLFDDDKTGEDRWHYLARAAASFSPTWRGRMRLERVSDDAYFQDFGGDLAQTSRQYLRSQASIDGAGRYWIFSLLADGFQVIDESVSPGQEPYRRLPRAAFMFDAPIGRSGFQASLDSELVYFDRDTGVTGGRLDVYPDLSWNLDRYWGFLRANAGYRYTTYQLDLQGELGDESPDRGLPILSLDSGLFLERELASGNTQTLEPRLYYLYVPYEDQDGLPDFDTNEFTFGFAQLFHYNRYTGADRQSDANQLTLALSTRSIDAGSGRDTWSLGLGQIIYLDNPRVRLPGETTERLETSPFLGEFNWHPMDRFTARLGLQWDWEDGELDVGVAGLDHTTRHGHRMAVEYRFRRDRLDQFDVRYYWPINERWRLFSRVNWSLEDDDLLEGLVGAEYESCCWALRVVARRYLRDRQGGERDALYLELRLKGLGSFGRREPPLFYTPAP